MAAPQSITSELQKLAPSSVIELFELHLVSALHGSNDVYRFHAGVNGKTTADNIVWAGQTYQAYPVECEGFEYSGNGQLPRPKLRVSNILSTISALLVLVNTTTPGNDLIGAKVIRKRTLARYLDAVNFTGNTNPYGTPDNTAEFPQEIYYIARKTAENRDVVEFELASAFDLQGVRAPRRQCIANTCQWQYRSAECGYTGTRYFNEADQVVANAADDVCGKRVSSCVKRFEVDSLVPPNISTSGTISQLTSGQSRAAGQQLVSSNGWYRLVNQNDGNLCIYDKAQAFKWGSGTNGNLFSTLIMQADGNLVLYRNSDNAVTWMTNTSGAGNRVVMQNDGNLVVYSSTNVALWVSNTASGSEPLYPTKPAPVLPFGSFPGIGAYYG